MTGAEEIWGFARDDGRAGIRNSILVILIININPNLNLKLGIIIIIA